MIFGRTYPQWTRPVWPFQINWDSAQAQNLVFWFPGTFQDQNEALDLTNGFGSANSSPTFNIDPQFGPYFTYSGSSYHQFPDQSRYNVSLPYMMSWWMKSTTPASNQCIFVKNYSAGIGAFLITNGAIDSISAGNFPQSGFTNAGDGNWHHIAIEERNTSVVPVFWIDGVSSTSGSTTSGTPSYGSSTPIFSGIRSDLAAGYTGSLFDLRIYQGPGYPSPAAIYNQATRWELYLPGRVRAQVRHKSAAVAARQQTLTMIGCGV